MKNKFISAIGAIALISASCQKKEITPNPAQPEAATQNTSPNAGSRSGSGVVFGMLSFDTFEDYENLVNDQDEAKTADFTAWAASQSYNSLLDNPSTTEGLSNAIHSDLFKTILNDRGCVKIGDYLIKVDPLKDSVYILAPEGEKLTQEMVDALQSENTSQRNITAMESGWTTLAVLREYKAEGGPDGRTMRRTFKEWWRDNFCGSGGGGSGGSGGSNLGGIGGDDKTTGVINIDNAGSFRMEGKIHFNRFGIYYHLFAELETASSGVVKLTIDLNPVYWKNRVGASAGPYTVSNFQSGSSLFKYQKYDSYQGSHNLNEVRFNAQFHGKIGSNPTKDSQWIEIRKNC